MNENKNNTFDEYKDLYELTRKTVDEHIKFYRNKESLFVLWKKLSKQAENFDKKQWTENWYDWHKNIHAFEKHKFETKFLIQHYVSDVLEALLSRIINNFSEKSDLIEKQTRKTKLIQNEKLPDLIKKEIKK